MQDFDLVFILFKLRTVTNECDAFQGCLVESYRHNVIFCQKLDRFGGTAEVIQQSLVPELLHTEVVICSPEN